MYKPTGLLVFNKKINETKPELPNSIIALFFISHIFYGFNAGFTKHFDKTVQNVIKVLSITAFLIWISFLLYPIGSPAFFVANMSQNMSYAVNFFEYITFFLILNFTKVNVYEFYKNLSQDHDAIPALHKESLGIKASVYVSAVLLVKYCLLLIFCVVLHESWCDRFLITDYLLDVSGMSLDAVSLILLLITYYIYSYVKKFDQLAGYGKIDTNTLIKYYLQLADNYDSISPLYDRIIVTLLLFEVPKLMLAVWGILQFINLGINWFIYVSYAVMAAHIMARMILPSILTEIIKAQVEAVELTLTHRLLQDTEVGKARILELLEYMSVHRLNHQAWRVIPLDMNLPLLVLTTCVTYLIVIVQFSHLYDEAAATTTIAYDDFNDTISSMM